MRYRSVNLEPAIAKLARDLNYKLTVIENAQSETKPWVLNPTYILHSRSGEILDSPALRIAARPERTVERTIRLWTDDFTSLFQILGTATNPRAVSKFAQTQSSIAWDLYGRKDLTGACVARTDMTSCLVLFGDGKICVQRR